MLVRQIHAQALRIAALSALVELGLTPCSETVTVQGHQCYESDLQRVSKGMGQDQVRAALGTPTTTSAVGTGSAYYYISSTEGQAAFFKPTEKDRKVLAV